nr:hypothetical protein [Tanacetum cinerariifolium]
MPNTFLDDNIALDMMRMENDRLMELLVSQDLVHTAVNSLAVINDSQSMKKSYIEEYEKKLKLAAKLSQMNELSKTCSKLEQHCISLELELQHNKESFQNDKPCENRDALEIREFFIIIKLKAQLQAKDITISNLKKHIQELKGKSVADCSESMSKSKEVVLIVHKVDLEPLPPKLKNNREAHVDYIRIIKENADTLRDIVEQARTSNPLDIALAYAYMYTKQIQEFESVNKSKVFALAVLKLDLEPLSSKFKNNREAHVDFIRITRENADTLRDIVKQARISNPLDNALSYACMYTKQIQELLVYVSDTCPSSPLKDNDEDSQGMNVEGDELDKEEANKEDEDVPVTTTAEPLLLSATTLPPPPTPIITHLQQTPVPLLANTNQFAEAISLIPGIVDKYLDNQMNEAMKVAVQLQSDRLRDEAQAENKDFLNKLDENIKKIIKEQVKEQVKAQVSEILPKIKKTVNKQLENEVLTHSSSKSKTSHAITANLSELELKKILIDKMERNKSIHRSAEQKNLHKALVIAYESDKLILDTYGDTVMIKRCRDDQDEDEEPSAGSNQGSKSRRARKEPESTSAPKEKTSMSIEKSTEGSKSHHKSASKSALVEEPMHTTKRFRRTHTSGVHYRDDNKLYKFKEGDFNWLRIQDIKDMLLLFVQGKLTNLTVAECLAFNVSLRMFTRSIVIQRRVKDLQLGVESYQKKINLTKPDTYILDLKRKEAYTAYSNPKGFIYQNRDKKNRLMCIDELHKFSDGTLNDVRIALDDRLKGIRMQYLPQTIWRRSDKDKAGAMIQAIDKQLKSRRIMWSLEKFVGGRLYERDLRLLQRTI